MALVVGRGDAEGPVAELGTYRARDGSAGAPVALDVDRPHAVAVVGKRGYGKSYTLGVLAEELADTPALAPVVVDPLGVYRPLGDAGAVDATVHSPPAVSPDALAPQSWCPLLGLSPEGGPGALVWRAARAAGTLAGMEAFVADAEAPLADRRAARNHLATATDWGVFDPDGLTPADLTGGEVTVLDCAGLDAAPMNAVGSVVADACYRARVREQVDRLPWLLVDEAHAFFEGVAREALSTVLTRGRAPGVSLVVATQRPSALPEVCLSQSDVVVSHRLTAERDLAALSAVRPSYMAESFEERMPTRTGEAVLVDDATESVHAVRVRERRTPHGGSSPRASALRRRRSGGCTNR